MDRKGHTVLGHNVLGTVKYKPLTSYQLLFSGALAGAVSKTVTAPIDRVKILYQVNAREPFTAMRAINTVRTIWRESGATGFWRGNGAAMYRVIPYSAISFMSFERYHKAIVGLSSGTEEEDGVWKRFLGGALAGATATILTYPFDLMRARMAAHWGPTPLYKSYVHGFQTIVKQEGWLSLFNGIGPTLLGIIPYAGLSFGTYETLKAHMKKHYEVTRDGDVPVFARLVGGGAAGLIAQTATYPLHVVRRRIQCNNIQGMDGMPARMTSTGAETGVWQALQTIYRNEGVSRGLFKGVSLTWFKAPIAIAIAFNVNDAMRDSMRDAAPHKPTDQDE